MSMFHYATGKKSGQDKNKNQHKFLDSKRDTHARLKALQRLLELQLENEEKQFFEDHSTEIFYLFYEEFTNLELNAKSKGAKLKDELEELLALLEKIFINLADELHAKWQFNCIGLILRKLLHHGNVLAIREHGLKLFMLWLLILQDKVDEFHLVVFGSIVPGFPSPIDKINIKETHRSVKVVEYVISCINGQGAAYGAFNASLESETEWCIAEGGSAICPPQAGEKVVSPEELTKKFLDRILTNMTCRMLDIQWNDKHKRESGFFHIFSHFKRFYLPEIFPLWNPADRLYYVKDNIISVPITELTENDTTTTQTPSIKIQCQSAILGWLIMFTAHWLNKPKVQEKSSESSNIDIVPDEPDGKGTTVESTSADDELSLECAPIVRYVLYATKDNVLLVHEIFRQGFLMPLSSGDIMMRILSVYKEWFFNKVSEKPLFMQEPKGPEDLSLKVNEEPHDVNTTPPSPLRSSSYKHAVITSETHFLANIPPQEVCAGFHANLRLFIAITGQVFFVKQKKDILSKHADICKKVMKLYRNIVLDKSLDAPTWRQLLIVLLKIIDHIFTIRPPSPRHTTLGGQLGSYLLQTLFVTWVRASLEVYLSLDLWDELLRVGSSFTCWEEMVKEWAGTMETLTRVMARTVYGIDLNDPPLSQLTQRGNLRKFKKISSFPNSTTIENKKSLSGWTHFNETNNIINETTPVTTPTENKEINMYPNKFNKTPIQTTDSIDSNVFEDKEPSNLQINSNVNEVKIDEESQSEIEENGFADQFVPDQTEETKDPFESTVDDVGPADFADFAAHFPETTGDETATGDVEDGDSSSEFGDSELGSNSDDNNRIMYETLNDAESVSSSLNIPLCTSLESFFSESSQNLLGEEYDTSDQSDRNTQTPESLPSPSTPLPQLSMEDECTSTKTILPDADTDIPAEDGFLATNDNFFATQADFLANLDDNRAKEEENVDNYVATETDYHSTENDYIPADDDLTSENDYNQVETDYHQSENDYHQSENESHQSENEYHIGEDKFDGKVDPELMISGTYSDSTCTSDEHMKSNDFLTPDDMISPVICLSDNDLISFNIDLKGAMRRNPDNQSIDSHIFTSLIDNESFNTNNINMSDTEGDIGEAPIAEKDMETLEESIIGHVRFSEGDPENSEDTMNSLVRSESFKSPDSSSRSVIEGGMERGWTQVSSVILWRRILGILGNINHIKDSDMHGLVFKNLIEFWQMLEMIKSNQGISIDNKSTPVPAVLTPPLYFCSTWCLQAMAGDVFSSHKQGRIRGFKLMCMMIIRNHGLTPIPELMTHFFRLLHVGLTGQDQDVANAIIAESALFYTREFESSSCLFLDFIHATNTIISTQYMTYPRKEAISLLGSMICLAGAYPGMKIYQPGLLANETHHVMTGKELREKILIPILKAAKNDPSCRARCIALSCLGLFIIESLIHWKSDQKIYECLALIISSLEFHSQTVCTVALDVLVTLTYYHKELAAFDENLPLKIIEAMCHVTLLIHSSKQSSTAELKQEETPEYTSKLLLCLLDWLMVTPQESLLKPCSDKDGQISYLGMAMKTFKRCSEKTEWYRLERRRSVNININQIFGNSQPIRLARVHNDLSMDDPQGVTDDDDTDGFHTERNNRHENVLLLTANYCIDQLLNYFQHFPFDTGAVQPISVVLENDDHKEDMTENQSDLIDCENVQFLLLNRSTLVSVGELPQVEGFDASFQGLKTVTRFVLRDIAGKYCWDVAGLFDINKPSNPSDKDSKGMKRGSIERKHSRNLSVSVPRLTTSCSTQLPTWENADANVDQVDQLLRYIGHSSPECLLYADQQLNIPAPVPDIIDLKTQCAVVTAVLKEHNEEENYVHEISNDSRITATEVTPPEFRDPTSPFHYSKLLLHQLNYFTWENRPEIELLERNEKLLRDIKNLDKRASRETQKIAVFYVAPGQEDKHSILSNSQGSPQFEEFIAGIGWEVDLATHTGFMGGLEKNLSTGVSAPYFATHSLEVIFHVSTRMPGSEDEELKTKLRHLGNDEIHIVWSEHQRDFRRGIINTEFGDVLIIIYPMQNNLFRIHIDRDPKIPPFGPLYDGVIIDGDMLPRLVRCAAINAGRAKRGTLPFFNRHYEERARCIREIAQSRVRPSTFEEFTARTFSPRLPLPSNEDIDTHDSVHRTFSVPTRVNVAKDTSAVLTRLLDLPDKTFRDRSSTGFHQPTSSHGKHSWDGKLFRSPSANSLSLADEDVDVFSDSEQNDYTAKNRRRSLPRRLKRKPFSMDVTHEKLGD